MSTNRRVVCEAAFGFSWQDTITSTDWVELKEAGRPRIKSASWSFGRSSELEQFEEGRATVVLSNRDRYLDPDNVRAALVLTGNSGGFASTPDNAALDITGDIDLRAEVAPTDWTPSGVATTLIAKWRTTSDQRSYMFQITSGGTIRLIHSPDGTVAAQIITTSTTAVSAVDGARLAVRVTMDVNDGGGNRVVNFYTSDTIDGTWTQLGSTVTTAGTTSIFNSTAVLEIGSHSDGITEVYTGKVYAAEVRSGIAGTLAANPRFKDRGEGTLQFVDSATRTWTVNGDARIVGSPFADDLLPNTPIRLRSKNEDTGTFEDEFYGYVHGGWQQQLAPVGTGDCILELVDLLGVFAGYTLPDIFHQAILDHNPIGFWVLDGARDEDAEQVADQGSGRNDGMLVGEGGVTLGDKVITPGHRPAARFDVVFDETLNRRTGGAVDLGRSPVVTTTLSDVLLVATFQARANADDDRRILFTQATGNNADWWSHGGGIEAHLHTDGRLIFGTITSLSGASPRSVVDGRSHIVFASNESLGIDTATLSGAGTVAKPISTVNGAGIGGIFGLRPRRWWDGWIGVVALFASNTTVGSSGRSEILTAYTKLAGQRSDQHITWALDHLGVPAGLRNLAVGTVIMGPAVTDGKDALSFMREVAATEGGGLYVDHRDGGKVRFTDRYHRFLQSRSTTSQATFTDDPDMSAALHVRYSPDGLDVASNGMDSIVNEATVTWAAGELTLRDATSVAAYGSRTRTVDTVAATANQARSVAEWLLVRYAQPRSRIRGATAADRSTFNRHDKVQALKIDDRVTFRIQPLHLGTAATVTLYVDGVSHSAVGTEWVTSFQFAQGETFTPWVWGTSAWDTTAYWG